MPREGVPYPSREICSLKCQIDALNRKIDELMKSVNGVQGDGQGNVSLISGDPALVINNDQVHNEIELTLDPSLLPAAAVSSVNGQTGAVAIEAADVPASGGSDVQTELNAHATDIGNLFNADGYEATARQNGDSALQANINAVQAGIPAAAAAAVAADPTVAQLRNDVVQAQSDIVTLDNTTIKTTGNVYFAGRKTGWSAISDPSQMNGVYRAMVNMGTPTTSGTTTIVGKTYERGGMNLFRFVFNASLTISGQERITLGTPACKIGIAVINGTLYLCMGGATGNNIACFMDVHIHKGSNFFQPVSMQTFTIDQSDFIEAVFP